MLWRERLHTNPRSINVGSGFGNVNFAHQRRQTLTTLPATTDFPWFLPGTCGAVKALLRTSRDVWLKAGTWVNR
eukprot:15462-Amphidinium_carterae.1